MSVLEIRELQVAYQTKKNIVRAVCDFTVEFQQGINVIVGYSGCGKSTLLRSILGVIPYEGEILFDGVDLDEVAPSERNFSFVSQEYALYPHYTVFDNIAFPLKLMGAERMEITKRVRDVAKMLDLEHCLTRKPRHISGGQQQRVALARAFVKNPSVCLLDEPFSNSDVQTRLMARHKLREIAIATGCMIIYVTHDFSEAMALADKLFVMHEGRLQMQGSPMEVYESRNEIVNALKGESSPLW